MLYDPFVHLGLKHSLLLLQVLFLRHGWFVFGENPPRAVRVVVQQIDRHHRQSFGRGEITRVVVSNMPVGRMTTSLRSRYVGMEQRHHLTEIAGIG